MKVSLIVAVYNVYDYLERCLESLINQTYRDIEILLINDGSTDKSEEIMDKYIKKDKRIKKFNKENGGLSSARNYGLEVSSGDYLMFLDSDDYFELDMVEKMLNKIKNDNSEVCICNILKEYEDDTNNSNITGLVGKENVKNALISLPSACNKMFKKTIFKETFPLNKYYEDLGTIPIVIANAKRISYVDESLYHYIQRNGSIMHQKKYNKKLEDIIFIMDRLYSNKVLNKKFSSELEYIYIKHLLHDASLRFMEFDCAESKESIKKIRKTIKNRYPKWNKNKYLNLMDKKELILTKLIYYNLYFIYNIYRKVNSK